MLRLWMPRGVHPQRCLAAALKDYPRGAPAAEEARRRLVQLASLRKLININKALAALHEDDEFQSDAAKVGRCDGGKPEAEPRSKSASHSPCCLTCRS